MSASEDKSSSIIPALVNVYAYAHCNDEGKSDLPNNLKDYITSAKRKMGVEPGEEDWRKEVKSRSNVCLCHGCRETVSSRRRGSSILQRVSAMIGNLVGKASQTRDPQV